MIPSDFFKFTLALFLLSAATHPLFAQAQNKNPDLQRELTLEKEYSPSLRSADKIHRLPEIKAPEPPKTQIEFSNYTPDYALPPSLRSLEAVDYFQDIASGKQRGYLNLSASTLLGIDGDAGLEIFRSETSRLNIFASRRSSNRRVSYLQSDRYQDKLQINDNLAGLDFKHRFSQSILTADAQYTRSAFNYYGLPSSMTLEFFPTEDDFPEYNLSTHQVNHLLKNSLGLTAIDEQPVHYQLNLTHTLLKHKRSDVLEIDGKTENRFLLDAKLYKHIDAARGIGFDASIRTCFYRLPQDPRHNSLPNLENHNYATIRLNPHLTFEGDTWNARLGLAGNIQWGGVKNFLLSPDLRFYWRPSDPVLLYLTADGGFGDNSAYNIYHENRYVNPLYRVADSKSPLDATLGITLAPLNDLSLNLFSTYQWLQKEHFYFTEWAYYFPMSATSGWGQKMLPLYADAQVLKLGTSIRYHYRDLLELNLKLVYNQWNVTKIIDNDSPDDRVAWNKPVFAGDWDLGFTLPPFPDLRINLRYHLETGRKALEMGATHIAMKDIHDLNLAGVYALSEKFSFFVGLNNLLFQKYDLWYGYPAQGFSVAAGFRLKF